MAVRARWFMVWLEYPSCLLFFRRVVLSAIVTGILTFLTMIVKLSISVFNSVSFSFMYFEDLLRVVHTLKFFISLNVLTNLSLQNVSFLVIWLSLSLCYLILIWPFLMFTIGTVYVFFHSFILNLFVYLNLKCVSYKEHIVGYDCTCCSNPSWSFYWGV